MLAETSDSFRLQDRKRRTLSRDAEEVIGEVEEPGEDEVPSPKKDQMSRGRA